MPTLSRSLSTAASTILICSLVSGCQTDNSTSSVSSRSEVDTNSISRRIDKAFFAYINKCSVNVNYETNYVPAIQINLDRNGALMSPAVLLNPSKDPNDKEITEAAFRSVTRCNPFSVGKLYPDYYSLWNRYTLKFDINLNKNALRLSHKSGG